MSLYYETKCDHGYEGPQDRKHAQSMVSGGCWGGVRRLVAIDYESAHETAIHWGVQVIPPATRAIVDAALAEYLGKGDAT